MENELNMADGFDLDDFMSFDNYALSTTTLLTSDVDNGTAPIVDSLPALAAVGSPIGSEPWSPGVNSRATFNYDDFINSPPLHDDPLLASGHGNMDLIDSSLKPVVLSITEVQGLVTIPNSLSQDWLTTNIKVEDAAITTDHDMVLSPDQQLSIDDILASLDSPDDRYLEEPEDDKVSDDQLVTLSVKQLNQKLQGRPANDVKRLKQRRRTLKNRGYAQNCRTKRNIAKEGLEQENTRLLAQLHNVMKALRQERKEKNHFIAENQKLVNDNQILTNAVIQLRDAHHLQ